MITLVGIEKVIPKMQDLALLLPMLAAVERPNPSPVTTHFTAAHARKGECDGPEEYHVILLDNGRSRLAKDKVFQEILQCIRCGSCINVCPIYKNVGDHTYNSTYRGPSAQYSCRSSLVWKSISIWPSPALFCGACRDMCPCDLPLLLLKNRERPPLPSPNSLKR